MNIQRLILYRMSAGGELLQDMARLADGCPAPRSGETEAEETEAGQALAYGCIHRLIGLAGEKGFRGNLWHCYLTDLLVNHENSFSRACELRGHAEGTADELALHDMSIFRELYAYDFGGLCRRMRVPEFSFVERYDGGTEGTAYSAGISARICRLAERFGGNCTPEEMKEALAGFYGEYGVGRFGLHGSFRIQTGPQEGAEIEPIPGAVYGSLADLVGYEAQKRKLRENTEAFVSGRKANNCLLFGDAGTGKSSCVKAVASEYYGRGLRIIEVYKHQFRHLNEVVRQLKGRGYKFIIFMDDLSFEDFEIEYKYLKAVIEGGLEGRPENVLIYATSNRRHLIRENYGDKTEDGRLSEMRQDMHAGDTVQEKLSLACRFGVTIYFGSPDKKQFQGIVSALAQRHGISMPEEELFLEANKWELSHGGLSGRTAQQFIDYILGTRR